MTRHVKRLGVALVLIAAFMLTQAGAFAKKRVAVLDFGTTGINYGWFTLFQIGTGIPDQLVTKLVNDGTYSVIERERLNDILSEQDLGQTGRLNPRQAAALGKMLGADVLITGSITSFGFDGQEVGTNVLGIGSSYIPGIAGSLLGQTLGGLSKDNTEAKIEIDTRMIDVTTGEVIGAAHTTGKAGRDSLQVGGLLRKNAHDFQQQIMSEAIKQAVHDLSPKLVAYADKVNETDHGVEAIVADVTGNVITLNQGSNAGLKKGDKLDVKTVVKTIKDPSSGRVLREVSNTVATIEITSIGDTYAEAKLVSGQASQIKTGAKAETVSQ